MKEKILFVDDDCNVLAAMLSQIGCVTIPGEILEKRYQGVIKK
jgi:hypothetical protein